MHILGLFSKMRFALKDVFSIFFVFSCRSAKSLCVISDTRHLPQCQGSKKAMKVPVN